MTLWELSTEPGVLVAACVGTQDTLLQLGSNYCELVHGFTKDAERAKRALPLNMLRAEHSGFISRTKVYNFSVF